MNTKTIISVFKIAVFPHMNKVDLYIYLQFRDSITFSTLAYGYGPSFPLASDSPLPFYLESSVPPCWLNFRRVGFSNQLENITFPWRTHIFSIPKIYLPNTEWIYILSRPASVRVGSNMFPVWNTTRTEKWLRSNYQFFITLNS